MTIRLPATDRHVDLASHPAISGSRWERTYGRTLIALDLLVGLFAGAAAYGFRFGGVREATLPYVVVAFVLPVCWTIVLRLNRAYEPRFLFVGNEEYRRVVNAGIALTTTIAVLAYATNTQFARGYVLLSMPLLVVLDVLARYLLRRRLARRRARGECMHRVVVLGRAGQVDRLTRQLRRERNHGMDVIAACLPTEQTDPDSRTEVPVRGSFADAATVIRSVRADAVVVLPCPEMDPETLRDLSWELEGSGVDLVVASALMDVSGPRISIRPVDGLPLLHVEPAALVGGRRLIKRGFDIVVAGLGLVLLAPMLLAIALLVRLTSRGPAFFVQTRVGKGGTTFRLVKFRSMYLDAEARLDDLRELNEHDGLMFKIRHDPRITPVGRWLRRFSLDELPQLFNIVRGEMSLVGPRPPLPDEVAQYGRSVQRRLAVTPGLTGLWQVSGRSSLSWEDSVRLDLRYVENWSLTFDLVILLRTVTAVVRAAGAY